MENIKNQLIAKLSPVCFMTLIAWGHVSYAAITPSAPVSGGPSVSTGMNGSAVININAAGKGGVSHNIYSQFDVDRKGAVLNNSATNTQSQLAGNIVGNANLANGSASIILNEVNSAKASQLSGMIEVAGQKAQVIVANPSGITCSGCGFINTDRATLTTGKPQVANGSLLGYTVEKGTIIVNGDGLNSADANYTDLISRAVQINADIRGKDLRITVGRNNVNADNTQIDELTPGGVKPAVAIDVSKLGGMYANKITMVSTDRDVGVRNAGTIGADLSDVNITTDGILTNRGLITAKNDVTLDTARGQKNSSSYYYANGNILDNTANGTVKAGNNINVNIARSQLRNSGGLLQSGGDINVVSSGVDNKYGNIQSQGAIDMHQEPNRYDGNRTVYNYGGNISGTKGVTISSYIFDNASGKVTSDDGGIAINTAGYGLNNSLGTIEACDDINLNTGILTNNSGLIQANNDVIINSHRNTINNLSGAIRGNNNIYINSASLNNTSGRVSANNYLDVDTNGGFITNTGVIADTYDAGLFSGKGGMTLIASNISNSRGYIASRGDMVINTSSGFNNTNGLVESERGIVAKTGNFTNTRGQVKSDGDMVMASNYISNSEGNLLSEGKATLDLSGSYVHYGNLSGKEGVNILASKGTVNNYGSISSADGMTTINSTNFYNQARGVVDSPSGIQLVLGKPGNYYNSGSINGRVEIIQDK